MAEMVPDRLPMKASKGEQKLFSVLQKLPDDYIVYYEPIVEDRYPDFVIICPDLGLLVIEVKGWYPKEILSADKNSVRINELRGEVRRNHPVRQARDYMLSLMDSCINSAYGKRLLQKNGEYQNRFIFPFGHFAILSNITDTQLKEHHSGDLTEVFTPDKVVPRDVLESWMDDSFTDDNLCRVIFDFFNPFWEFPKLNESQINAIRSIIHPEIILPTSNNVQKPQIDVLADSSTSFSSSSQVNKPENPTNPATLQEQENLEPIDLKVLDLRQENNARNIGEGHRIIYGVAGSGKTVLLIARARLLSAQNPDAQILLLCYNLTLASYLTEAVRSCPNVTVKHFDGWTKANNCVRKREESNKELGDRFLIALEKGCIDSRRYDAILIDEFQDFDTSWFKCVLEAMQEPNDGDLLIVGDGSQGLYGRTGVRWKDIGIKARGRTIFAEFDLDKNYRNSREIVELASIFATPPGTDKQGEDAILSLFVDPEKCQRRTGIKPVLVKSDNRREESTKVLAIAKNLLDGNWFGKSIEPLKPEEIAIFYPLAFYKEKAILQDLIRGLRDLAPVVWLNDPSDACGRRGAPSHR
jgi:AAA domain/Nuclease-related domain